MTTIKERLRQAMSAAKKTDYALAQETKVPQPTIFRIISGKVKSPRMSTIEPLARALNVSASWLLTGESSNIQGDSFTGVIVDHGNRDDRVYINEIDINASCGSGEIVFQDQPDRKKRSYRPEYFTDNGLNPEKVFTVTASGDSMHPIIRSGDKVTINAAHTSIQSGGIYLCSWSNELFLKYIERVDSDTIELVPENKDTPTKTINMSNGSDFRIIGKAIDRSGGL